MKKGVIQILVATILFSFNPLFVRYVKLDSTTLLLTSAFGSLVIISCILLLVRRSPVPHFNRELLAIGPTSAINNAFYFAAINRTTVANAILSHYLAPVFLLLGAPAFLKEQVSKRSVLAVIAGFLGAALLLVHGGFKVNGNTFGIALGIGSAIFLAIELGMRRQLRAKYKINAFVEAWWQLLLIVIVLIPFTHPSRLFGLAWLHLLLVVVLATFSAAGLALSNSGLRTVQAHHAGTLSYLEPFAGIVWASLFLHETLTKLVVIGGVLIMLAGLLVIRENQGHYRPTR